VPPIIKKRLCVHQYIPLFPQYFGSPNIFDKSTPVEGHNLLIPVTQLKDTCMQTMTIEPEWRPIYSHGFICCLSRDSWKALYKNDHIHQYTRLRWPQGQGKLRQCHGSSFNAALHIAQRCSAAKCQTQA